MKRYHLLPLLATLLFLATNGVCQDASVREGDIVFQASKSAQSEAIRLATKSRYSHMGLIAFRNGKPFVFEAVEPVRYTPLESWIKRGRDGHCVVKRLKAADRLLTRSGLDKIRKAANSFEGKHYDLVFSWTDRSLYCSELVWKIYDRALGIQVGRLQRLRDFDISSPVVQKKMRDRYGSNVPMDETVISPQAIFESDLLRTVQIIN